MNSLSQQSYLADFAPAQSLDKYAKGADPRVISGIVALSEMQQQAAMRQHAAMANGAAQGQMPTVRDKIMQMFQQANQPRQQPQQQPNPMAQGIMAQAPQEEVPQEAQMYHGGVARLPVSDRMFGYANGGIIAFKKGDEVPRVGEETSLTPEERARLERELEMRLIGERARAGIPDEVPANLKNPRMDVTDLDFLSVPGMEKSDVLQRAMDSIQQKREPRPSTPTPRPAKTLARPIGQETPLSPEDRARLERELEMRLIGERSRAGVSDEVPAPAPAPAPTAAPAAATTPRQPYTGPQQYTLQQQGEDFIKRREAAREANAPARAAAIAQGREDFRAGIANLIAGTGPQGVKDAIPVAPQPTSNLPRQESAPPPRLPDGRPNPAYAAFIERESKRDRGADPFAYDQSKLPMPAGGIPTAIKDQKPTVYSGPSTAAPQKSAIATLPGGTPAPGKVTATPGGTTIASGGTKPTGNTTPIVLDDLEKLARELVTGGGYKPSTPKSIEQLDKEKQDFVAKQPTSEEALSMIKHLDRMAKRYEANDQAEEAQRARNAGNNLWTFLMNTRGSSLGVAAGKANAALQPLLADQETRRQNYQKLRDEQELALGKYRYELAQAERARKEGRFDDARKHQLESQKAELEVAKLAEQERGNKVQGITALLRNKETQRHHEETMARLRSSDAQRAQEHAERMAFKEKQFGSQTDLRRQQLMQTNPSYKRITEMLEPLEMVIAGNQASGKKVDPKLEAQAAALRMQKQQLETQFGITDAAPSKAPPGGKVIDFNTIGK